MAQGQVALKVDGRFVDRFDHGIVLQLVGQGGGLDRDVVYGRVAQGQAAGPLAGGLAELRHLVRCKGRNRKALGIERAGLGGCKGRDLHKEENQSDNGETNYTAGPRAILDVKAGNDGDHGLVWFGSEVSVWSWGPGPPWPDPRFAGGTGPHWNALLGAFEVVLVRDVQVDLDFTRVTFGQERRSTVGRREQGVDGVGHQIGVWLRHGSRVLEEDLRAVGGCFRGQQEPIRVRAIAELHEE